MAKLAAVTFCSDSNGLARPQFLMTARDHIRC